MNVAGFKFILGIITIATVVAWALIGFAIGRSIDALSGGQGAGGFLGLLIGGGLGWVIGAYVHGISYTLLSINDHLAEVSLTLKRASETKAPPTSTGNSPANEFGTGNNLKPVARDGSNKPDLAIQEDKFSESEVKELREQAQREGYQAAREGKTVGQNPYTDATQWKSWRTGWFSTKDTTKEP